MVKAAMALEAAKKAAKALKEKQRRDTATVTKRDAVKSQIARQGELSGLIVPDDLDTDREGQIKHTLDNCIRLLSPQGWGFSYNELALTHVFRGDVPWEKHYGRELNDAVILKIRVELLNVFSVEFSHQQVRDALLSLCRAAPFNPVVEYLDGLKWDNKKRVEGWLSTYLGAADTEYTRAVGMRWLMAAVARAKQPGVKFDSILILEGAQGSEKSGALAVMGGAWFSDAELGDLKSKEAAILLLGVWLQELAELGALTRGDVKDVKAFASRCIDKFRAPYEPKASDHPRCGVMAATDNSGKARGYLRDDTGNRRFWPVETGTIDIPQLKKDRDMLWAEATALWAEAVKQHGGEAARALVLPRELWAVAAEEQKARLLVDPWVEQLTPWLENPFHEKGEEHRGYDGRQYGEIIKPYMGEDGLEKIHSRILLAECLNIPPGSQTPEHGRRARAAMAGIAGWSFNANLTAGKLKGIGGYVREG